MQPPIEEKMLQTLRSIGVLLLFSVDLCRLYLFLAKRKEQGN